MSESMRMLKTREGQLNAVFACFGSAAQHAQFFEDALAIFLLAYNQACNKSLSIESGMPIFRAYLANIFSCTAVPPSWLRP